jgi:hypothetical protein
MKERAAIGVRITALFRVLFTAQESAAPAQKQTDNLFETEAQ